MGTHYPSFLPFKETADSNWLMERKKRERKRKKKGRGKGRSGWKGGGRKGRRRKYIRFWVILRAYLGPSNLK